MKEKIVFLLLAAGFLLILLGLWQDGANKKEKANVLSTETVVSPTPLPTEKQATPSSVLAATILPQLFTVKRVVDGDTIELTDGRKVRYIGINAPETVDPRRPVQCFGKEASNKNKELVEGKRVRLEKDISETDKFGRLLRYVYVDDLFVNDTLVRQGYAYASSYPPDVKYQELFHSAQKEAQENNRGLWASCPA